MNISEDDRATFSHPRTSSSSLAPLAKLRQRSSTDGATSGSSTKGGPAVGLLRDVELLSPTEKERFTSSLRGDLPVALNPYGELSVTIKRGCASNKSKSSIMIKDDNSSNYPHHLPSPEFYFTMSLDGACEQTPSIPSSDLNYETTSHPGCTFTFPIFSYQSKIQVQLIESSPSSILSLGRSSFSIFQVIELQTQQLLKSIWGAAGNGEAGQLNLDLVDSKGQVTGEVLLGFDFKENILESFSTSPPEFNEHRRQNDAPKDFSLDNIKSAYLRIVRAVKLLQGLEQAHRRIIEFENPLKSVCCLVFSVLICLKFDPDYIHLYFLSTFLAVLTLNLWRRLSDLSAAQLVNDGSSNNIERTIAQLRLAVVSAGDLRIDGVWKPNPLCRCYYSVDGVMYYIGRTPTIENTQSPNFQTPQKEMRNAAAKNWYIARSRVRKMGVKDAALHNVTSCWKHEGGQVDWHCLKYPILQPVGKKKTKRWSDSSASLHFELLHAGAAKEKILGKATLQVKDLITDEKSGGVQILNDSELPLLDAKGRAMGVLRVRTQVKLPLPRKEFTEMDRINMETLEAMLENEEHHGIISSLKKVRDFAISFQASLESLADFPERLRNLVLWAHPKKTAIVYAMVALGCFVCFFVPFRYMLIFTVIQDFTRGLRRMRKGETMASNKTLENIMMNLLSTMPNFDDISSALGAQRGAVQDPLESANTNRFTLQAKWSGEIQKRGELNKAFQQRFVVVRNGYICWWKSRKHAERGMPPRGKLYLAPNPPLITDIERVGAKGRSFVLKGKLELSGSDVFRYFLIERDFESFRDAVELVMSPSRSDSVVC